MNMRHITLALCLGVTATAAMAQSLLDGEWKTYRNARFGFEVPYPAAFTQQPASDNGDGVVMTWKGNTEVRVWGQHNATNAQDVERVATLPPNSATQDNYFTPNDTTVIAEGATTDQRRYFVQTQLSPATGVVITTQALYPAALRDEMEMALMNMMSGFRMSLPGVGTYFANPKWTAYHNERLGFTVPHPTGTTTSAEHADGNGATLTWGDGEATLRCYGMHSDPGAKASEVLDAMTDEIDEVTAEQKIKGDQLVLRQGHLGDRANWDFVRIARVAGDGSTLVLSMEYRVEYQELVLPVVQEMAERLAQAD